METLSDIVAQIRAAAYIQNADTPKSVLRLADRIEAAWRREKAEIEADALSVGGVVEAARHTPGNAAAMRDALEEISSVGPGNLKEPIDGDSSNLYQDARYEGDKFVGVALPAWVAVDWYRKLKAVKEKADSALSAPARNCDRFADETDAQIAFLNEVWLISVDRETMLALDKYENWSDGMRTRYGRWLLAPAAERKGENS